MKNLLAWIAITVLPATVSADEFSDFVRAQQAGVEAIKNDYQAYKKRYLEAFDSYKTEVEAQWQNAEMSDQDIWVNYSPDLQSKQVIDYAFNEIRLSYKLEDPEDKPNVVQQLAELVSVSVRQAAVSDPVNVALLAGKSRSQIPDQALLADLNSIYGSRIETVEKLASAAVEFVESSDKGPVYVVKIPLPHEFPIKRAEKYFSAALTAAEKWDIDPALVMAIAHTESHFNPLARSHVPAYGLMQIVPSTAGKDASKLIYGEAKLLTSDQLFNPEFNLETGSAYMNMLQTRYLKGIKDPLSRLYCAIAAYNTGTGNVAKAFIGQASMQRSFKIINQLSPEQVFNILEKGLPYEETRKYLVKVSKKLNAYQQVLARNSVTGEGT